MTIIDVSGGLTRVRITGEKDDWNLELVADDNRDIITFYGLTDYQLKSLKMSVENTLEDR